MKRVIISTFLFFVFLTGWAQSFPVGELNDNMQRFYKGCMTLREGISSKDVITLDKAIELLDDDAQNPDRIELYSLSLGCADTLNQCSMQGHMYYDADYAEFFKENMGLGVYSEAAESLRGKPSNCQIAHRAIKANSKVQYTVRMAGSCQMFVLAEIGGSIKAKVNFDNDKEFVGVSYDNGALSYLKWEMNAFPPKEVTITIENVCDKEISYVIVSN